MDWLITFTQALRKKLPAEQFTISHAPVAPWFSDSYKDGGYLAINKAVGDAIDWYVALLLCLSQWVTYVL